MQTRATTPTEHMEPFARKILFSNVKPKFGPPSERDVLICEMVFSGVAGAEVRKSMGCDQGEIMAALKRVRDSIRRGECAPSLSKKFPEIVKWQLERSGGALRPIPFPEARHGEAPSPGGATSLTEMIRQRVLSSKAELLKKILGISSKDYGKPDPEQPGTLNDHRMRVHAEGQAAILPALYQEIGVSVLQGDSDAMGLAADIMGLRKKGGGVTIAQQFNMPGAGSPPGSKGGRGFEQLLREAKSREGENLYQLPASVSAEDAAETMIAAAAEDTEE